MNFQRQAESRVQIYRTLCLQGLNTIRGDQSTQMKRASIGSLLISIEALIKQLRSESLLFPRLKGMTEAKQEELLGQDISQRSFSLIMHPVSLDEGVREVVQNLESQIEELMLWEKLFGAWLDSDQEQLSEVVNKLTELILPKLQHSSEYHVKYEREKGQVFDEGEMTLYDCKANTVDRYRNESMTLALINRNLSQLAV